MWLQGPGRCSQGGDSGRYGKDREYVEDSGPQKVSFELDLSDAELVEFIAAAEQFVKFAKSIRAEGVFSASVWMLCLQAEKERRQPHKRTRRITSTYEAAF